MIFTRLELVKDIVNKIQINMQKIKISTFGHVNI